MAPPCMGALQMCCSRRQLVVVAVPVCLLCLVCLVLLDTSLTHLVWRAAPAPPLTPRHQHPASTATTTVVKQNTNSNGVLWQDKVLAGEESEVHQAAVKVQPVWAPSNVSSTYQHRLTRTPHTVVQPAWCAVQCSAGTPCQYLDEVDLRIMVLTFDRPSSLATCLGHVSRLHTLGHRVSVEVWVDRSQKGYVSQDCLDQAYTFQTLWQQDTKRRACVHIREKNAGIAGQWTDTWRPRLHTKELGLILEDDVDISPWAYQWLRAVHGHYGGRHDVSGYTLQMQNINFFAGELGAMMGPPEDTVFMYPILGTWGFSPHPANWRLYQDWSHIVRQNKSIKPYVEGIKPTRWYQSFEESGREEHMWEMWHIYFAHVRQLYCVYSNLKAHTGLLDGVLLSWNRFEPGLHFSNTEALPQSDGLMAQWRHDYAAFPLTTIQFMYNGTVARRVKTAPYRGTH